MGGKTSKQRDPLDGSDWLRTVVQHYQVSMQPQRQLSYHHIDCSTHIERACIPSQQDACTRN